MTGRLYSILEATLGARLVTVSSNGYQNTQIDFENFEI